MDFWTFLWYLILAGAVIAIAATVLLLTVGLGARATMNAADGIRESRNRRAHSKWEMIEAGLDDDEEDSDE